MNNHKIRAVIAVFLLLGLMAGAVWPVVAQGVNGTRTVTGQPGEFKAGQVLVKFKAGMSLASTAGVMKQHGATYERTLYGTEIQTWQVPEGSELAAVEKLNADPAVQYAELNYRIYAHDTVPNDPSLAKQWAHTEIMQSPAAWGITTGSAGTIIAILDSGVDGGHPDLAAKLVPGYDFVDNDADPHDLNGHGTHVAGIAAARTDNGIGVAGMDWQARIMPVRVLDAEGGGFMATLAEGIGWAYTHGAKVLNISSGGPDFSLSVLDAVNAARGAGSMVVASMGNDNSSLPAYPAAYDSVVAVSATGRYDVRAWYSNYGNHNDLAAPGGTMSAYQDPNGIYSTMPTYPVFMTTQDNYLINYDYVQGTSQAAPYVAGLAALVWSLKPSLTVDEVQEAIETTAVDLGAVGWDRYYGHGRIDPLAALLLYGPPYAPTLAPIRNPDGDGTYLVDWNDVSNAASYVLQQSSNGSFSNPAVYSDTESRFQVVARPGGTWYYRVLARNDNGDSPWSNVESVGVRPEPPMLSAIDNLGNEDEYWLVWSVSEGANGYVLEEDEDPAFGSPTVRYQGSAKAYHVTGQPGGTWHYRVWAYNLAGSSSESNTESTSVNPATLTAPFLNLIDNEDGDDEFLVSWVEVPGATSYRLEESSDVYFSTSTEVYSVTVPFKQVDHQSGGTWYYRVRAIGPGGKSPWSHQRSVVVPVVLYLPLVAKNYDARTSMGEIENGDFEDGPTVWTEYSLRGFDLIIDGGFPSGVAPHGGDWAAWLGGGYNEFSYIEQRVDVPPSNPYLHYWHWISSITDPCGQDSASVWVNGALVDIYHLCLTENTGGWQEHSVDLGAYAGQSIDLQIKVRTWPDTFSSLFVDDVWFRATAAAEQPATQGLAAPATLEPRIPSEPAGMER